MPTFVRKPWPFSPEYTVCRFCNRDLVPNVAKPKVTRHESSSRSSSGLTAKDLVVINSEVSRNRKSNLVAYLLFFFLGGFGFHKFYLRQPFIGMLYIFLFVGGILLSSVMIGFLFLLPLWLFLFLDLFFIPGQVYRINQQADYELLRQLS